MHIRMPRHMWGRHATWDLHAALHFRPIFGRSGEAIVIVCCGGAPHAQQRSRLGAALSLPLRFLTPDAHVFARTVFPCPLLR